MQYHFERESVLLKRTQLKICDTDDQLADPFTKPLEKTKHIQFRHKQGLTYVLDE